MMKMKTALMTPLQMMVALMKPSLLLVTMKVAAMIVRAWTKTEKLLAWQLMIALR